MNLVNLEGVRKQYAERVLLGGVDLRINAGERIGLIGVNGSGKSTLLRIIAGDEPPDEGTVTVWGNVRIRFLSQSPDLDADATVLDTLFESDTPKMRLLRDWRMASRAVAADPSDAAAQNGLASLSDTMEREGGWAAEAEAKAVLSKLGIEDFEVLVGTLSGGQRKRVALARALLDPADLLILDEPTNHVDAEAIAWLERYLARVPRALLMVTHDRYFLDRVVNRIVELDRRQLVSYEGNYASYLERRSSRQEQLAQTEEKQRGQLRRELEWLRKGAKARTTKQKARVERVEELRKIAYESGDQRVALALAGRRLGKKVLTAKGIRKSYDGKMVLDGIDLRLEPGDRLGIVGPNGAGKSTLLDMLAGELEPDAGTFDWGETTALGYFDQRGRGLRDDLRLIDYVDREAPIIHTRDGDRISSKQMLEFLLFTPPDQQSYIGSLSGGERRRLYLLRTLIHQPNVLFLDEPTNDLDIQTLGVLEDFLDRFVGALVVVSHDRYFLDRTVDQIAVLEDGKLSGRYPSPFETFLRLRADTTASLSGAGASNDSASASENGVADVAASAGKAVPPSQPKRKLSWKEQREFESLEADIERLEARKAELEASLGSDAGDYQKLQAATDEIQQIAETLDEAVLRWMELGEIAEAG